MKKIWSTLKDCSKKYGIKWKRAGRPPSIPNMAAANLNKNKLRTKTCEHIVGEEDHSILWIVLKLVSLLLHKLSPLPNQNLYKDKADIYLHSLLPNKLPRWGLGPKSKWSHELTQVDNTKIRGYPQIHQLSHTFNTNTKCKSSPRSNIPNNQHL